MPQNEKEPDEHGRNWKAPKRNAVAYSNLRRAHGVLTLEKALELAALGEGDLVGAGRRNVIQRLKRLDDLGAKFPDTDNAREVVEQVLNESLWVTEATSQRGLAGEDIARLRREALRMLDEARTELSLQELVQSLRYRIATKEPLGEEERPDIKIVTLWGAKGLTADFVYIVGLCDEALPGAYDPDATGLNAGEHEREQLRLLYVSLTRAKRALVVSRPEKIRHGEVPALGLRRAARRNPRWQDLSQCQFISRVSRDVIPDAVDGEHWEGIRP